MVARVIHPPLSLADHAHDLGVSKAVALHQNLLILTLRKFSFKSHSFYGGITIVLLRRDRDCTGRSSRRDSRNSDSPPILAQRRRAIFAFLIRRFCDNSCRRHSPRPILVTDRVVSIPVPVAPESHRRICFFSLVVALAPVTGHVARWQGENEADQRG